jgi:diguanylate cyclase (GGDEF)-like protein
MDVQTLEISVRFPGQRKTRTIPHSSSRTAPIDSGGGDAASIASRRPWLFAYTAISIVAGLTALVWTTMRVPISPSIDPNLNGWALAGPSGGLILWIAFGMIGSMRVLPAPGGHSVWTFHFPFVAAAMVLGGPTAGAWVAFVSTLERRELEDVPWYGTLANHAVLALAAVVGGLTVEALNGVLLMTSVSQGVAGLIAVTGGTLVLAAVLMLTTAGTIMLREGLSAGSMIEVILGFVGRMTVAEVVLAWVFTIAYTAVGWWSPLALALTALLLWPVDIEGPDSLTNLPRLRRFRHFLDGAIGRTRHGLARGGVLVAIDLDNFGPINKNPLLGQAIGDEVLAEIGRRLRGQARTGDAVARPGGDEFGGFFAGTFDRQSAVRLGERLLTEIRRPIVTSAGIVEVGASIGLVIVVPGPDLPDNASLMKLADVTMQAVKHDGGGVRLCEPTRRRRDGGR